MYSEWVKVGSSESPTFNGKLVTIYYFVLITKHIKLNHRVSSCDRIQILQRLVEAFGNPADACLKDMLQQLRNIPSSISSLGKIW